MSIDSACPHGIEGGCPSCIMRKGNTIAAALAMLPIRRPQPAPSGDEAKVRTEDAVDIAKRHWDAICAAGGDQLDYVTLDDACVEAYAAGKADVIAAIERKSKHELRYGDIDLGVELQRAADIARRGSEGK